MNMRIMVIIITLRTILIQITRLVKVSPKKKTGSGLR